MLSFRGFSEINGLHVLLKFSYGPCTRKPFAGKIMLSVLSLFLLHDFLLSSVGLCLSFAFVCKHYNIIYLYLPLKVIHIYTEFPAPEALHRKTANGIGFAVY